MLGDCHIHAVLDGADFRVSIARHSGEQGPNEAVIRAMLAAYRDAGVTYLRDGGDRWGACLLARDLAPEYGIEYAAPGAPLFMRGSYGSFIGLAYDDLASYRELVAAQKAAGANFIKLMLSGIMDFKQYGRITGLVLEPGFIRDLIAIAHDAGMPVMAHVNGARSIQAAVEAGVDSVEHGYYSDAESRACLAESDTVWVPTLAPVRNLIGLGIGDDAVLEHIVADHFAALREVHERGGIIAAGDDAGAHAVPHGPGILGEYEHLRDVFGDDADGICARGLERIRAKRA